MRNTEITNPFVKLCQIKTFFYLRKSEAHQSTNVARPNAAHLFMWSTSTTKSRFPSCCRPSKLSKPTRLTSQTKAHY